MKLEKRRHRNETAFATSELPPFGAEVEHRPALCPAGGNSNVIDASSIMSPSTRIIGAGSLMRTVIRLRRQVAFGLVGRDLKRQRRHHPAILGPQYMLFVVVANGRLRTWTTSADVSASRSVVESGMCSPQKAPLLQHVLLLCCPPADDELGQPASDLMAAFGFDCFSDKHGIIAHLKCALVLWSRPTCGHVEVEATCLDSAGPQERSGRGAGTPRAERDPSGFEALPSGQSSHVPGCCWQVQRRIHSYHLRAANERALPCPSQSWRLTTTMASARAWSPPEQQ